MNKIMFTIFVCMVMVLSITGCEESKNKLGGDIPLKRDSEKAITITTGNKSCIPVQLTLYEDGVYELFTAYESCRPGQNCTAMLKYTKSIKGKYDYDIMKILDDDSIEVDKSHAMDYLPEYEIYMGNYYVENGYGYYYTVEKGKTNKYLDELLQSINIDLKICANPEYIDS